MRFRKLYADLVTDSGDVLVVYLAWLRMAGLEVGMGGVELYRPDATAWIVRGRTPQRPAEPGADGRMTVRLELPMGALRLDYRAALPSWAPDGPPCASGLRWRVVVPRAAAVASGPPDTPIANLTGHGYVDEVELGAGPRGLGLRTLDWGRVHLPNVTWVYTGVRFARGAAWRRVGVWRPDGDRRTWRSFHLEHNADATRIRLPDGGGSAAAELSLRRNRTLHTGDALDSLRLPSITERAVFRLLAGRITEARWLSDAYHHDGGRHRFATLHERVRFGQPSRLDRHGLSHAMFPRQAAKRQPARSAARRFSSSGDTSSTWVATCQTWPNGSSRLPVRSP